jgi:hypothetical protein
VLVANTLLGGGARFFKFKLYSAHIVGFTTAYSIGFTTPYVNAGVSMCLLTNDPVAFNPLPTAKQADRARLFAALAGAVNLIADCLAIVRSTFLKAE